VSNPPCTSAVGIVINPLAGTDIRRLVSSASPTTEMAKIGAIRRAVIGAISGGARQILLTGDRRSLAERALERIERDLEPGLIDEVDTSIVEAPPYDHRDNTVDAARRLRDLGAGALVVFGGDGTHRDVVSGWREAPMVAVSTGTNNVFPRAIETTLAGHAAAAVATGRVPLSDASWRAKVIDVEIQRADGRTESDLGLVDVALVASAFTGSRAVWHGDSLRHLIAAIAEPASVGLSAIAAAAAPCGRREPGGVHVEFDPNSPTTRLTAPIAPGRYATLGVASHQRIAPGETVTVGGPGALSFDGERDAVIGPDDHATLRVANDGPHIIDVEVTMAAALHSQLPDDHTTPEQN
jgi:hypothetical protein